MLKKKWWLPFHGTPPPQITPFIGLNPQHYCLMIRQFLGIFRKYAHFNRAIILYFSKYGNMEYANFLLSIRNMTSIIYFNFVDAWINIAFSIVKNFIVSKNAGIQYYGNWEVSILHTVYRCTIHPTIRKVVKSVTSQ